MRLLRSFHLLAFVLVFLSIVGLALAQRSVGLLLMAGALAAISWYVTEGPRGRTLPHWVSNVLVLAVALHTVVEFTQGPHDIHILLGRFGLWLTLIKLYERRTARDHAHLLMLSFLLMLVACLSAVDLLFGIVLIAYIALGLYVLLLYQLHASFEQAKQERQVTTPEAYRLLPPLKPIIGKRLGANFRSLTAGIGVAGLVLGLVSFVAFPRDVFEGAIGAFIPDSARHRTGFTESIDLNYGGRITESRRPVMTVQLLNLDDEPIEYPAALRLRGGVLDHYDGDGRWRTAPTPPPRPITLTPHTFQSLVPVEPEPPWTITQVVRSHLDTHVLFSLYSPMKASADRTTAVVYNARGQTASVNPGARPLPGYRVRVHTAPEDDALEPMMETSPPDRLEGLQRLKHTRTAELAQQVLLDAGFDAPRPEHRRDPEGYWLWAREAAQVLTRYFHSPLFSYTLDVGFAIPEVDGRRMDPIHFFLFEARRGHCEFYASALTALCANLGIEARVVTGYLTSEFDAGARHYNVLERNAHAWVEVRTGEKRWTAFDPTPAAALSEIAGSPASMGDRLLWMYDRAASSWSRNFIDFDSMAQRKIAERLDGRTWLERLGGMIAMVRDWLHLINQAFHLGPAGYIYIAFVTTLVVFSFFVLVSRIRRAARIRRKARLEYLRRRRGLLGMEYQRVLRDSGYYLEMLHTLEQAGASKPDWMPPLDFAEQLDARAPAVAAVVRELTRLFYRSRYGHRPLSQTEVRAARGMLAQLETAVATWR